MNIAIGGGQPTQPVYVELFDQQAPTTVANFINYIENKNGERRYDGTFIHRSLTNFVIQGGGFRYDPANGAFDASVPHIAVDDPVVNEFDGARSNIRGTIAMAKQAGDPNSATSEWFINLADNSANLDGQNGGFTVFGRVLDQDMPIIDMIAALSTENLGAPFTDLPTVRTTSGTPPSLADLVVINDMEIFSSARIRTDIREIDFGIVSPGSTSTPRTITVQNVGGTNLTVDSVINPFFPNSPFSVARNTCAGNPLPQAASCEVDLVFQPVSPGVIKTQTFVNSNDATNPSKTIQLNGVGAFDTATLSVGNSGATTVDFGRQAISSPPILKTITLQNTGNGTLSVRDTNITGDAGADYTLNDTCSGTSLQLAEICTLKVTLSTDRPGKKTALLSVTADPSGQSLEISLTGEVIPPEPVLIIPETNSVDLGDTYYLEQKIQPLTLNNGGAATLKIRGAFISGNDANLFSFIIGSCTQITAQQQNCTGSILFAPDAPGTKTAVLTIQSNDPNTPQATLPLTATASQDRDGIPDAIEAATSNSGDANRDGIADATQDNVASLKDINGDYVALESDIGTRLNTVLVERNPAPESSPTTIDGSPITFPHGFFSFFIEDVAVGGDTTVTLRLPESQPANAYLKYNPVTGNWSTFRYDPASGTGAEIVGNRVILHFVDGGRGDADLLKNGRIIDPGAPAVIPGLGDISSGGGGCTVRRPKYEHTVVPLDFVILLAMSLGGLQLRKRPHKLAIACLRRY